MIVQGLQCNTIDKQPKLNALDPAQMRWPTPILDVGSKVQNSCARPVILIAYRRESYTPRLQSQRAFANLCALSRWTLSFPLVNEVAFSLRSAKVLEPRYVKTEPRPQRVFEVGKP